MDDIWLNKDMLPQELAQYKQLFLQTAWDYLRQLEGSLDVLVHDLTNEEAIASSHLASHSLKSQCAVMQYNELSGVCQEIERMFRDIKTGSASLTEADVTALQTVISSMKESLAHISADNEELSMEQARAKLPVAKGEDR